MNASTFRALTVAAVALAGVACQDGAAGTALAPSAPQRDVSGDRCGGASCTMSQTIALDPERETITLPVYQGAFAGSPVYYIVTESSDQADAQRRGVNYAPKLRNALGTRAVQRVTTVNGIVTFSGTVRFASTRSLRAGPDGIPPGTTPPSSVGDANYSPLITAGDGIVLNASQVANASGVHDALISLDIANRRVTLGGFLGFWESKPILYLHMDASKSQVSDVEGSTLAPNLDFAPGEGSNDREFSARSAILPIENGIEPRGNLNRQGLNSFTANQGDPLNITQEFPGKNGDRYSPVWDVHTLQWRNLAARFRLTRPSDAIDAIRRGDLMSDGTGPANPSLGGIRASDAISNCPIVAELRSVEPGQRGTQ